FKGSEAAHLWKAFGNSVVITIVITIGSNLVEAMAAYPLSKRDCPIRGGIMMYFIITMLFSAGTAPIYLLMRQMNLTDNIWSCILISISNVGNLLYFKVFFEGLPKDIEDSARLDGASEIQMFFRIVIPMSLPVIGSCCFFSMVGAWNGYGSALLFINPNKFDAFPLAYYLYLLNERLSTSKVEEILMGRTNIEAAAMLVSIIPIICCYPYVIRYIKGGLMIGSVKE
ncbi:MAG: carbohydrate ABC transporter permease, partial [Clostridia bacterium]|nr:carbohydrate ABC transporter permease [Clostridia bacterium]